MRQLALIILILATTLLKAQVKEVKKLNKHDLLFKITPTSILDPGFPKLEFGVSYVLDEKVGIQTKLAQKIDIFHMDDNKRYDGYKFSIESQYLFSRKMYVAIESGILRNKVTGRMQYYVSESDQTVIEDEFQALNEKVFAMLKFGHFFYVSNRLILDVFGGVGIEYNQRTIEELEFDSASGNIDTVNFYEWFGPAYTEKRGPGIRFSMGLNINWLHNKSYYRR